MAHVHHIVSTSEAPGRALDESNCVALCEQCHNCVEGMVRTRKETCQLFGTSGVGACNLRGSAPTPSDHSARESAGNDLGGGDTE